MTATVERGSIRPDAAPLLPHLNRKERTRLACLRRRRDFLTAEIATDTFRDRSYDRQEVAALTWAIQRIEEQA